MPKGSRKLDGFPFKDDVFIEHAYEGGYDIKVGPEVRNDLPTLEEAEAFARAELGKQNKKYARIWLKDQEGITEVVEGN